MSATKNPEAEFAYGSGHINPLKVVNPGLVYDAGPIDYLRFLCGQRYSTKHLRLLTKDNSTCDATTSAKVWDLNYPSFALSTSPSETNFTRIFNRVVTNVGTPVSTYRASVTGAPVGLRIRLNPSVLSFTSLGQTLSFTLTVEGTIVDLMVSASLVWDDGVHQAYIVYMGSKPKGQLSTSALHMSMLRQVADRNIGPESLLYNYRKSFDGFVVKMTEEEAKKMAGMSGVVSVFPNRKLKLHTTRSWDFMGFSQKVERATTESDVIIGVFDTGIWPESESFNDTGFGPPPTKWRGTCQVSANFTCNNKIIGAKYYRSDGNFGPDDIPSPRDSKGHGTHTASTAAGNLGISINTVDLTSTMYPLIYGGDAPNVTGGFSNTSSRFCDEDSLDKNLVKGKIVLCDLLDTGEGPFHAGAAGVVIQDTTSRDYANSFPLPTSYVNNADGSNILTYIKSNRYVPTSMSTTKNPEAEFGYGSGHINPLKVVNPGLVYDAGPIDYIRFLCGQKYSTTLLRLVTGDNSTCDATTSASVWDLNYPSFALSTFPSETNFTRIFNRVVTNVGTPVSTYRASVTGAPAGLRIRLNPSVLSFTSLGQKMSFTLTVEGTIVDPIVSTSLVWDDGVHQVRSPIVVFVVS
ncbi:hypothetical protein LWI28_027756 [Acer negundo]|uniref:Cucumisin n=1 Tax=Acer negundo TaxID=4023 RepID=A0AAD5IB46_ACENE|nr:hypothetical protein LWI28_027756 [Acer negundo]